VIDRYDVSALRTTKIQSYVRPNPRGTSGLFIEGRDP
jgi:hypothetical protein